MVDYTSLSDEELMKAAGLTGSMDYSKLSDEELMKAAGVTTPEAKTNAFSGPERFARSGVYGLTTGAEGLANLAGKIPGADPQRASKLMELVQAGKDYFGVGSSDFQPATQVAGDSKRPLSERITAVPRSILEMAGPAALGGLVGGLPGAVATVGATEVGPTIDRVRQEDKTDPNAELTTGQQARVAGKVGLDMLMAGVGGKATLGAAKPIMATGFEGLKQAGKQTARAALTDAAAADVAITADKGLVEGKAPSMEDLVVGGLQGGLPGAAFRAPKELAGGLKARENILGSLDPQSRNRINERIQAEVAAGSKDAFKGARDNLENELGYFKTSEGVTALTKDLEARSGYTDRTKINIENAIDAVKRGDPVSPATMKALRESLGGTYHGDNLLRLLEDHQNFNTIETKVNDGGVMSTGFGKAVTPFGKWPTTGLDLGATAVLLGGHHIPYLGMVPPEVAAMLLGAQGAGFVGGKITDRLTGASNVPKLLSRVSGPDTGPEITSRPYQEVLTAARAQQDASRLSGRQTKAQQAKAERDAAKTDKVLTDLGIDVGNLAQRNVERAVKGRKAESEQLMREAVASVRALNKRDDIQSNYESGVAKDLAAEQKVKDAALSRQADLMRRSQSVEERRLADEAKAEATAEKERNAALARQLLLMRNSSALEQRQSSQAMRDARDSVRALQNRDATEARGPTGRGEDLGLDANVPLPELVSSDATLALRSARLKQLLEKQTNTDETRRQNDVLAQVRRQLDLMNNSAEASATDADLALRVARLKDSIAKQAEPQGPTAPEEQPVFSSLAGTQTGKLLEQARATEKFNRSQEQAKEAASRKAKRETDDATKAKAAKKAKDAEEKAKEAELDADPNLYVFEHRGVKIRVDKESISNPKSYEISFKEKTNRRMDVIDGAKGLTKNGGVKKLLDQLAVDWTDTTNDPSLAYGHMEELVNDKRVPKAVGEYLLDNWDRVKGTWATKRRDIEND